MLKLWNIQLKQYRLHLQMLPIFLPSVKISEALGDITNAMAVYEKSVAADKDYLPPRINLGKLYDEDGQFDKALNPSCSSL